MDLSLCAPWVTADDLTADDDGCAPCGDLDASDEVLDAAALDASQFLHGLTGHRYPGICEATIAPCHRRCSCDPGWMRQTDSPLAACGCGAGRTCCGPLGVTLGVHPVTQVVAVTLDGQPFTDHALVGDVLVRTDGGRWPACQDLTDPTFTVEVKWGAAPSSLGRRAARDLACLLARADCGDESCREPANTVRKTGGGVTVEISSPVGDIVTGLPRSVRMFLEAEGVYRSGPRMRRPRVGHRIRTQVGARRGG